MIKRTEIKYPFKNGDRIASLSYLTRHSFYQTYPARRVSSLYFDTMDFKFHYLGEEGIVPRDKVRLRWYGHEKFDLNKVTFEIKKTFASSRIKYSKRFVELDNNTIEKSGHLSFYKHLIDTNVLLPTVLVTYDRMYFGNWDNSRATIDSNIKYHKCILTPENQLITLQCVNEEFNVLELKDEISKMAEQIQKSRAIWLRFSKYSRAMVELLKK